jgi:hypothetical protein
MSSGPQLGGQAVPLHVVQVAADGHQFGGALVQLRLLLQPRPCVDGLQLLLLALLARVLDVTALAVPGGRRVLPLAGPTHRPVGALGHQQPAAGR